jgi:hypothetical protein
MLVMTPDCVIDVDGREGEPYVCRLSSRTITHAKPAS